MTAAEYAERFGVRLYEDAEEMVVGEKLDTVVIITPHTEHATWAERMAQLGMDIFIPKTFATSLADAERIVQAAAALRREDRLRPQRPLPAAHDGRASGRASRAHREALFDAPCAIIMAHWTCFTPATGIAIPRRAVPELSLGWYGIDLVQHLMGEPVQTVYAQYDNFTTPDSPFMDCGRIEMRLASGGLASFDMYFCNRVAYPSWQLEIVGPEGVISIHRAAADSATTVVALDGPHGYEALPLPERAPNWESFWIDDFLTGTRPAIMAEDAAEITRISLAARESAATGAPVML